MPKDVPVANRVECDYYGAHVTLIDGLISDCARKVADMKKSEAGRKRAGSMSRTTKEPYRVEGKKTMGYEVAEQLGWRCRKASSIPPAAASDCSACGRPSKKWKPSAGSAPSAPR